MLLGDREVLICSCEGTMALDGTSLAKACGSKDRPAVASHLCRHELENFLAAAKDAARDGTKLLVACTQEAPLFLDALEDLAEAAPEVGFVNLREHAGWSEAGQRKTAPAALTAKMAALLAAAAVDLPPTPKVTLESPGILLVLGRDEAALEAAKQLAAWLDVTVVLPPEAAVLPPRVTDVPVFAGRIAGASGHLGAYEVRVEDMTAARPSSRDRLRFEDAGDGAGRSGSWACSLILDLRGGTPLFPAPDKRDGYFRADPDNPLMVLENVLALTSMAGTFEKPRYVDFDAALCAHGRSRITGCTRCLDACPAGAIAPAGDVVGYDPYVCAGCGLCAATCPTGAARYDLPADGGLGQRLQALLTTYRRAGGGQPVLLVHDVDHGETMIEMIARFGRGLPANVLPFAVNQTTQIGLDFLLMAAAYGAERTLLLLPPAKRDLRDLLATQLDFAEAALAGLGYGEARFEIVDDEDPESLAEHLYGLAPFANPSASSFLPLGRKRSLLQQALDELHAAAPAAAEEVALPAGAPFGAVSVDAERCTLCLSCVSACPTGALSDDPAAPRLSFQESACVQCGLCRNTCPESAITLTPRLNFRTEARGQQVLHEEEPFHCVRCGVAFASEASLNRTLDKLAEHPMFAAPGALDQLKMCQDCRVAAMMEGGNQAFALGEVPRPRTTADYLREREEAEGRDGADRVET